MLLRLYSSHFAQLFSHYSHSDSFCSHQFAKSLIQCLYFNSFISKWTHTNENIRVFQSKCKETKTQIFTWLHAGEIKSTFELLDLVMCPGYNPNLHRNMSKEQPCILVSTRRKPRNPGQEMTRTAECSVASLKLQVPFVFQHHLVPYRFPNQSPSTS